MPADVADLRYTIVPKSDQINAEQLLGGPMTITVTDVRTSASEEQPVVVHYQGENGRPYKPCKTMRKVLIFAWGEDGRRWVGRSMTLYNDASVRFGGQDVGGIRISHLTDIDREVKVSLTATKGKKALHSILPLEVQPQEPQMTAEDLLTLLREAALQGEAHLRGVYEELNGKQAALADVWKADGKSLREAAKKADAEPKT